jgi:hypothetical protein
MSSFFRRPGKGAGATVTEGTEPVVDTHAVEREPGVGIAAEASGSDTNLDAKLDQLAKFKKTHQWDFNLDYDQIAAVNQAADADDVEKKAEFEKTLLEENSPYFEVRQTVRPYDE